ncbi:MAG: GIY-YIG nuclease family protein [Alphaproteobacteria bacterium]|nr:GIY-YIG nuclease family protein [Alphaproteobacteria bacterium]
MLPRQHLYIVYILASQTRGTLYVGVTSDLLNRTAQHRDGIWEGFTRDYGVKRLVYFETFDDVTTAIRREKRLKKWLRAWKIALIEKANPRWTDLWPEITGLRETSTPDLWQPR